ASALGSPARGQVIDLTNPGDAVVGGVAAAGSNTFALATVGTTPNFNNSPMTEQGPNVADNSSASKYLNFAPGRTNVAVIVTPSATALATAASAIRFTTANAPPEPDPAT